MREFERYPNVKELIEHYARKANAHDVLSLLSTGIEKREEATRFANFIWQMIDLMYVDCQQNIEVLGSTDNSSMMPDIQYEASLFLANSGFEDVWDQICDEQAQ